jgi:type I restriction enzyme S subunit
MMPGINVTRLKQLRLFVVPKVQQDTFAERALEIAEISRCDRATDTSISKLRQSLSGYAFTGELTAGWRERHKTILAQEAAARDEALKASSVMLPRTTMLEEIEEMLKPRTEGAYAELTREQRVVLEAIERGYGGVDYPRWFTAEEVARSSLSGALRGNPQAVASHLSFLAARGLVIAVSREEQNEETGEIVYGNAYRLPLRGFEPREGEEREPVEGDDSRLREMQRLVARLEKERLQ